jgi:hypothetical protein
MPRRPGILPTSLTCDHAIIRGRQAGRPGPETRARTGPGLSQSRATPFVVGGPGETLPGIQGPRNRPGQAQSSAQPTPAHCGTEGLEDTPGHSPWYAALAPARPLTVPAYHEAHTGRRAGEIAHGIQVAREPAQPCPAHAQHPWDGGPARSAYGQDRPGHCTSQWHPRTHSGRPGRGKPAEAAVRT